MKNKLLFIGGGLVLALVVAYFAAGFVLGSIVRAGVNHFAPDVTKTPVELASARISPLSGSGTLDGLFVGNPKGWSSNRALYFEQIHVEVEPMSLFSDHIVVDEITIDHPQFVYETRFVTSNISQLLDNIESSTGGSQPAANPTAQNGRPLKFEVKRFRLVHGEVTLGVGPTAITLPMPPVVMDDLGTAQGGITASQLSLAVMKSVLSEIVTSTTQAATKVGTTMGAAAGNAAGQAVGALKGLFGQH
jgi:hypothetical protein